MVKSFVLFKKRADLTQEEFLRYWKEKHGPLAAKVIPGLRKYVQCHPIKVPGVEFEYDGITETWWDSAEAYQNYLSWRRSEEAKVLRDDEKKFAEGKSAIRCVVEEHVIAKG